MLQRGQRFAGRGAAAVLLLAVAIAGCSSATRKTSSVSPAFCSQQHPAADCVVADSGRFAVAILKPLIPSAEKVGVSLNAVVTRSLDRIGRLLPGPETNILIVDGTQVIPQTGVNGVTDPLGQVLITLDIQQSHGALKRSLSTWLPEALAHEVDHSVRIGAGPGFGLTLLEQLISEGMSSVFDIQVEPTIQLPWVHALTVRQESEMWSRARPLLSNIGLYDQWFFGGDGVLHWAAFQIGYHIVRDYLARNPGATAASLVDKRAAAILSGSHYTP